ncbi:HPP family protein [Acidianus sp. DSM 29099]|nr:HPP family protein [Acidianus sp. RZ1]NON62817.1 HPP family protein [Acidianus sp. RZ1]
MALLNLIISILFLTWITIITKTAFILPPFLATAATKYPDPDWRLHRSIIILTSYIVSATIGIIFSFFGLAGIFFAVVGSILSFLIQISFDIEHPPSILATFLGVLEKVKFFFLIHPIISGVIIIETVNYLFTRFLEPKLTD